ncbi:hypothetical protein BGZ73_006426, partial [Actinomortierella ambigua]
MSASPPSDRRPLFSAPYHQQTQPKPALPSPSQQHQFAVQHRPSYYASSSIPAERYAASAPDSHAITPLNDSSYRSPRSSHTSSGPSRPAALPYARPPPPSDAGEHSPKTEGHRDRFSFPLQDPDLNFNESERLQSHSLKFGTRMPESIDIRAAIEVCETLCKFAIHYGGNSQQQQQRQHFGAEPAITKPVHLSALNEQERANLLSIRSMNMRMLTGFRNGPRIGDSEQANPSAAATGDSDPTDNSASNKSTNATIHPATINDDSASEQTAGSKPAGTTSHTDSLSSSASSNNDPSIQFGPEPPSDDLTHEMAKAANAMFQLAVRIKSWINMTPEERVLDEEINIIRGRRSLVMEDQGGGGIPGQSVVSSWVPVSTSLKSFAERIGPLDASTTVSGPSGARDAHERLARGGYSSTSGHPNALTDGDGGRVGTPLSGATSLSHGYGSGARASIAVGPNSSSSSLPVSGASNANGSSASRGTVTPYQKYKKRAKRMQPPGRCQSCNSSDTPEWRRGPDGARTLCNACGLHYAKLLKRQQQQLRISLENGTATVPPITFPLRPTQLGSLTDGQSHSSMSQAEDAGHRQSSPSPAPSLSESLDERAAQNTTTTTNSQGETEKDIEAGTGKNGKGGAGHPFSASSSSAPSNATSHTPPPRRRSSYQSAAGDEGDPEAQGPQEHFEKRPRLCSPSAKLSQDVNDERNDDLQPSLEQAMVPSTEAILESASALPGVGTNHPQQPQQQLQSQQQLQHQPSSSQQHHQ